MRKQFPLQSVEVVFEVFPETCYVIILRLALACVQEGGAEVFVAAKRLVEIAVGFQFVQVVVGVDIVPVVVVEVVVAAPEKANRSSST